MVLHLVFFSKTVLQVLIRSYEENELETIVGEVDKINFDTSRKHFTVSLSIGYVMRDDRLQSSWQKESKLKIVLFLWLSVWLLEKQ